MNIFAEFNKNLFRKTDYEIKFVNNSKNTKRNIEVSIRQLCSKNEEFPYIS